MYGLQRVCRLGEQKLMKNLSDHFYVFFFFFYSQMTENNLRGSKLNGSQHVHILFLAEFILLCSFLCRQCLKTRNSLETTENFLEANSSCDLFNNLQKKNSLFLFFLSFFFALQTCKLFQKIVNCFLLVHRLCTTIFFLHLRIFSFFMISLAGSPS